MASKPMTDPKKLVGRLERVVLDRRPGFSLNADPQLLTEAAACIREMVEWRDIETAPRDAVIMLFGLLDPHPSDREAHAQLDKPKRFTGYWDEVDEAWCPVGSTWEGPWIIPTHWLPLPPAPGAEA